MSNPLFGLPGVEPLANSVNSGSIANGSIDEVDLDASVNASLDLADTSLQPADRTALLAHLANAPYFVSTAGSDTLGTGSSLAPFATIQKALDTIGDATSAADVKKPQSVVIHPGVYDEDLTLPRGRILTLVSVGTVILGNGLGSNWTSTNARSVSVTYDTADVFGSDIKPTLNFGILNGSDATSTFIAESGCFIVSGDLNIAGNGQTHTLNCHSVKITGTITKTATGLTNFQAYRSYFVGAVNMGTATILERAYDCQFDALVTVDGYNALIDCELKAGMTVATNYNTVPPSGFFHTTFTGIFTGTGTAGIKLDDASNYFFVANGASLAGGATKTIVSSLLAANISDLNVFKTISVSGQNNVVADNATDTLTLAAGSHISITTNDTTDTITIATSDVQAHDATLDDIIQKYSSPYAGGAASFAFSENTSNGTNTATITAPDSLSGNIVVTLPSTTGKLAAITEVNDYTAQQNFVASSITSTSNSIAWNLSTAQTAKHTATEDTTLANPTNMKDGGTYILRWTQHASSPKTLAFGSAYKWPGGVAPTVTATNGAVDIFTFVSDGTNMYGTSVLALA